MADAIKVVKFEAVGLREMKSELDGINRSLDQVSEPGQLASLNAEAGQLNGKLSTANKELSEVGKRDYSQVSGNLSKIAGGLGAIGTAAALAFGGGDDADEFFKTMSTGASITMGVVGVLEMVNGVMSLFPAKATGATAAQTGLNVAMSANVIGLIVLGVVGLIAAFVAFKDPIIDFISNWENLVDVMLYLLGPIGWIILAYQKLFSEEAKLENAREDAAEKEKQRLTEKNLAHKKELANIKERNIEFIKAKNKEIAALDLERDTLEANGKSSDEVTVKILEAEKEKMLSTYNAAAAMLMTWTKYYKSEALLSGLSEEQYKEQMKKKGVDLDKLQAQFQDIQDKNVEAVIRADNAIKKFKLGQKSDTPKAEEGETDAERDARIAEETRQAELKAKAEYIVKVEELENQYAESKLSKEEKELNAVTDKYYNLIKMAEKHGVDTAQLEADQAEQEAIIAQRYRDEEQKLINDGIAAEKAANDAKIENDKETANTMRLNAKALRESQVKMAASAFQAIGDLASAFAGEDEASKKKAFQINKAMSLGIATANTALAVTGALTAGGNPIKLATGAQFVEAGIAAVAGAAQIAVIAKSKFGSGGSATPSTSGAGRGSSGGSSRSDGRMGPNVSFTGNGGNANNVGAGNMNSNGGYGNQQVVISEVAITDIQKKLVKYSELSSL